MSHEFSAFANTEGGMILIGDKDTGEIKGLSSEKIHRLNQWISNAASQNIKPPVSPLTEIITVHNKNVLVVKIPSGYSKPYYTNEGVAYIKMGSDKRIASPEEIYDYFKAQVKYTQMKVLLSAQPLMILMKKHLKHCSLINFDTDSKVRYRSF